jgi:type VI secretion system protein ImpE
MTTSAQECFDAGRLADAIQAQVEEVRARPADAEARFLLFSLLAFSGDLERASRQLDALGAGGETGGVVEMRSLLCRGLLAAEAERREVWAGRSAPLLAPDSGVGIEKRIEALARLGARDAAGAARLLDASNAALRPVRGTLNGSAFEQIRDSDDFSAPVLEVFARGRCLWLGLDRVRRLELQPPASLLDLLWAPARLLDARGNDAHVYLPTLYCGTHAEVADRLRLGRVTEWRDASGVGARGVGQRVLLTVGAGAEQEWSLLDVRTLEVEA